MLSILIFFFLNVIVWISRALNPHGSWQAVLQSLSQLATAQATSPQRTSTRFDVSFQDGKETSESQFWFIILFFSLFILMQTNAIHLGFLLSLKLFKNQACLWGLSLSLMRIISSIPGRQWQALFSGWAGLLELGPNSLLQAYSFLLELSLFKAAAPPPIITLTHMIKH